RRVREAEVPGFVVQYEQLVSRPARTMQEVCAYLEIDFDPNTVLTPTKVGHFWSGNSAARVNFSEISTEPVTRWERELSDDEIGWVEWHCRDLMPEFGYEPRLSRREFRYFVRPIRGERLREYLKSRAYSLRDDLARRAVSAARLAITADSGHNPGEMSGIFFDLPSVRFLRRFRFLEQMLQKLPASLFRWLSAPV